MTTNQDLLNYVPSSPILQDRVILVTGAGAGIGRAVARVYARYGATVVLLGKTIKKLESVYDEIIAMDAPEPAIYPVNLEGATVKDYYDMAETIGNELGRLDGLLLNAGNLPGYTPLAHYEPETWSRVMTSNLTANFLMIQACLPLLTTADDPAVVFSSHAAQKAYNGAFGVAKAGSDALLKIMADEYDDNPFIRVNGIDTGPVRTFMRTFHYPGENPETLAQPEAVVGPYLYFMGSDATTTTGEIVRFERLPADARWPGNH